jgi:hypothetical protein
MNDRAKYLKPPHNPEQIEIRELEESYNAWKWKTTY